MRNYYIFIIFSLLTVLYSCDSDNETDTHAVIVYSQEYHGAYKPTKDDGDVFMPESEDKLLSLFSDDERKDVVKHIGNIDYSKSSVLLYINGNWRIEKITGIEQTDTGAIIKCIKSYSLVTTPLTYYSIICISPKLSENKNIIIIPEN